jgi:hypothetical protein
MRTQGGMLLQRRGPIPLQIGRRSDVFVAHVERQSKSKSPWYSRECMRVFTLVRLHLHVEAE